MDKQQAMRMVNDHLARRELTAQNSSFSNVNKKKSVWWFTIKPNKFRSDLHLLLAKDNDAGLIWLKIKANTFPNLGDVFRIRDDKHYYGCIDFEIPISGSSYMRDTKNRGTGYNFKRHIQREWDEYGNVSADRQPTKAEVIKTKPRKSDAPYVNLSESHKNGAVFNGTDVPVSYLFNFLDSGWSLYSFLKRFPSVSAEQALDAIDEKVSEDALKVMHSDRRRMSGTPVFKGTRLPVKSLFDHMAAGYSLDAWLSQFPTASKEQATTALDIARYALERQAYESAAR